MSLCPCGSNSNYEQCCGLYIEKKELPTTPEQLMRSRYTAYSQANINYIKSTMKGKALVSFNEKDAQQWAKSVSWIGLEVKQAYMESPTLGFVEFAASFIEGNQLKKIEETSEFYQMNGVWYYLDGVRPKTLHPKTIIGRTNPCPCGSGSKFKNCHEKSPK